MAKGEVKTLYACMICGRGWASKQSLRAHMKVHRGEDIRTTHIVVKGAVWDRFRDLCGRHHTTTCHLLDVLMRAALKGDETGMIDIGAPNPVVINIQEVFLGKPRSGWKVEVDLARVRGLQRRCPECGSPDVYEFHPMGTSYWDGRCRRCRAEWLIAPGEDVGVSHL